MSKQKQKILHKYELKKLKFVKNSNLIDNVVKFAKLYAKFRNVKNKIISNSYNNYKIEIFKFAKNRVVFVYNSNFEFSNNFYDLNFLINDDDKNMLNYQNINLNENENINNDKNINNEKNNKNQ